MPPRASCPRNRAAQPAPAFPGHGRGDPDLPGDIIAPGRSPRGHPEGLREAFASIDAEMAQDRMAREVGEPLPEFPYPRIEDGAHPMAFIEACLASQERGGGGRVGTLSVGVGADIAALRPETQQLTGVSVSWISPRAKPRSSGRRTLPRRAAARLREFQYDPES
jgi:hypothetical protein